MTAGPPVAVGITSTRRFQNLAVVVGIMVVVALHCRPWEVAFLEEWGYAYDWSRFGLWGVIELYAEWSLSRPLHLIPTLLGLTVGNGAPGAIFLVLAAVAAAQLPLVLWALRPLVPSFWVRWALGLFLALHPVWAAGYLQRFLPAQTAALALVVAMGLLIRWLRDGRRRSLAWACLAMLSGLCVYPGPAAVAPLMALALAFGTHGSTTRRKIAGVVAMTAVSVLMTIYALVVVRLIAPGGAYEQSVGAIAVGVREGISLVGTTLLSTGAASVLAIVAIVVLGAVSSLTGSTSSPTGWLIAGIGLVSPMTAVVFYGNAGWLGDIDRLSYVISLSLFVALCVWAAGGTGARVRVEVVVVALVVIASLVGGVRGVLSWQPYVQLQHRLLTELGPVMADAEDGDVIAVVDRSGTLGSVGAFPGAYLRVAAIYWNGDSTPVWICPRSPADHAESVLCAPGEAAHDFRLQKTVQVPQGEIDVYLAERSEE